MRKAYLKLTVMKEEKGNKGFYRYIICKRKARGNMEPAADWLWGLVTGNIEKADVFSAFSVSVVSGRT